MTGSRLDTGVGALEGAGLLAAAHETSSAAKYIHGWEQFLAFCAAARMPALPAAAQAVVRYLSYVKTSGTVAARSLENRLAPIAANHALASYPSPAKDGLVKQAKRGYRCAYTAATGARPGR